jgi:hypothetical protein
MEYAKVILPKVCFWDNLFKKELLKCLNWTENNEIIELISWCYNTFGEMHPEILDQVFADFNFKRICILPPSYSVNPHKIHIKQRKVLGVA